MIILKAFAVLVGLAVLAVLAWFVKQVVRLYGESTAYEQLRDTGDLQARIARLAEAYVAGRQGCRLVVGVWQKGRRWQQGFGAGRPEAAGTPDGAVLYEIGSVTKVFTGILLAQAEAEGRLGLDDAIGDLLPPEAGPLDPAVGAITLRQLATHTSGLPRLPDKLGGDASEEDPYANYRAEDLYAYLRKARLRHQPGKNEEYSNLGAGLLGHLLALRAGLPYEALLRVAVLGPLGMLDTAIDLSARQRARLIGGRTPDGRPVRGWSFDVLAPAGALHSTAGDLLAFLGANLRGCDGPICLALRRARETHFGEGRSSRQGLGWQIEEDVVSWLIVHWHNGGTGGYKSFIGLIESHDVGVVLLSSTGDSVGDDALDRMGFEVLRLASKVGLSPTSDVGQ